MDINRVFDWLRWIGANVVCHFVIGYPLINALDKTIILLLNNSISSYSALFVERFPELFCLCRSNGSASRIRIDVYPIPALTFDCNNVNRPMFLSSAANVEKPIRKHSLPWRSAIDCKIKTAKTINQCENDELMQRRPVWANCQANLVELVHVNYIYGWNDWKRQTLSTTF